MKSPKQDPQERERGFLLLFNRNPHKARRKEGSLIAKNQPQRIMIFFIERARHKANFLFSV